jgi:hypothetical protein
MNYWRATVNIKAKENESVRVSITLRSQTAIRRKATAALAVTALAFCATTHHSAANAEDMTFVGDLRQIATDSLRGTKPLKDILAKPNTYGLGMVQGLDVELLIINSEALLGGYKGSTYTISRPMEGMVAFGGFAVVPEWRAISIPADVTSFQQLEALVAAEAGRSGRDVKTAMPFRIEATAAALKWFVVGGMGDLTPSPRESFVRNFKRGALENVRFEAFGFYASDKRGIYTNPASSIHTHFRTVTGEPFIGHLDDGLTLQSGGTLFVPKS